MIFIDAVMLFIQSDILGGWEEYMECFGNPEKEEKFSFFLFNLDSFSWMTQLSLLLPSAVDDNDAISTNLTILNPSPCCVEGDHCLVCLSCPQGMASTLINKWQSKQSEAEEKEHFQCFSPSPRVNCVAWHGVRS